MQITAELDHQHLEKLHELEQVLSKSTSELIALAIDHIYQMRNKNSKVVGEQPALEAEKNLLTPREKNQQLIEMLAGIGQGDEDGSVKYKEYVKEFLDEKFKHHC